jgi:uncharacterized membrane protein YhaH (DUF805 family)
METYSFYHWLIAVIIVVIYLLIFLVPIAQIVHRAGFSRWWCVLSIIPLINFILLWVFAFVRWPAIAAGSPVHDSA